MSDIKSFPVLSDHLCEFCRSHQESMVQRAPEMVKMCLDLDALVPHQYRWRATSEDVLSKTMLSARKACEVNTIYWKDQARNTEAYSTTLFWRGLELLKASIRELNIGEVVASAVIARSLLELACAYLVNANKILDHFRQLKFPAGAVIGSSEFEAAVNKMLWGTRFGDPSEHLKQTNVLTFVQKVDKSPGGEGTLKVYEYLCDVAHPSFIGNTRFWSHVERVEQDGSEITLLERRSDGASSATIKTASLFAISISAFSIERAFGLIHEGLTELLKKLKEQSDA